MQQPSASLLRKMNTDLRRHWAGIFLAALILLLGASQAGAQPATAPQQAGQASLAIAIQAEPAQLDPALADSSVVWLVTAQIYETLANYRPGGSLVESGLAESWTVSPDGLTWIFNLRSGQKFHDGTALDASAVADNLRRWWDPAHPFHNGDFVWFTTFFGGYKGDPNGWLAGIATPAPHKLQLTILAPHSDLPAILAHPAFGIASPAAIQSGTLDTQPVGSGPFVFAEWAPGSHIRLEANPAYRGPAPSLDSLVFRAIPLDADRFLALEQGAVQVVPDLPAEYAAQAANLPDLAVYWRPSSAIGYLGMNRAHPPLDLLLVRQAIAHAVDRQALLDTLYRPGDEVAATLLPPVFWGSDAGLDDYTYDPALARDLLAQAGFPQGFSTTLSLRIVDRDYLPDPVATAEAIQVYLQAVGIEATVQVLDAGDFINKFWNGELDLFLLGWIADYLHPDNFFTPILCDGNLGFGQNDAVLCDTLDQARAEPLFAAQEALYRWATRRVHSTLPMHTLVHPRSLLLASREVHGLAPSPLSVERFAAAWTGHRSFLPLTGR